MRQKLNSIMQRLRFCSVSHIDTFVRLFVILIFYHTNCVFYSVSGRSLSVHTAGAGYQPTERTGTEILGTSPETLCEYNA